MAKMATEKQDSLPSSAFAFPNHRKEPITDAEHVRNAVARFDQVEGVTNRERDEAWQRIQTAARKFGVDLQEKDWRDLFKRNGHPVPKD